MRVPKLPDLRQSHLFLLRKNSQSAANKGIQRKEKETNPDESSRLLAESTESYEIATEGEENKSATGIETFSINSSLISSIQGAKKDLKLLSSNLIFDQTNDDSENCYKDSNCDKNKDGNGKELSFRQRLTRVVRKYSRLISDVVAEHTGSIGYLGSFAIACNSLTGPAMLELPAAYAESGFIPATFVLVFVCFLSAFCSLHMANSISKVKSKTSDMDDNDDNENLNINKTSSLYNHNFKREMEFSSVFSYFWGRWPWFYVTQFLFWGCITCLNISSIVDTSQVVDTILGHTVGSAALQIDLQEGSQEWIFWNANECSYGELSEGTCVPFASTFRNRQGTTVLLTVGTLVTNFCFLPMALMDLKENSVMQVVAFLVLLVTSLYFVIHFAISIEVGSDDGVDNMTNNETITMPDDAFLDSIVGDKFWWGYKWDNLFGVVLFNYALVMAIPAWLYEREEHVDVPIVILGSSLFVTILYISIGSLGRLSMPHVASNMLASFMSGVDGLPLQIDSSIFAFFIIGLGIPLFSVLTRLNLIGATSPEDPPMCSRPIANVLAVYLPFGISWFLYDGKAITSLLSWGGIVCTSIVAFILPLTLTIYVVKKYNAPGCISVFGWDWVEPDHKQKYSLFLLLVLVAFSITCAIVGKLV